MPLQNRVTPFGDIVAIRERGTIMGNRGSLHGNDRQLGTRRWSRKSWVCCRLEWKDIRREVMAPGRYTELFFLDDATSLAAGHRPCNDCRREDLQFFCQTVGRVLGGATSKPPRVAVIDEAMHADRISPNGSKRTYEAALIDIPNGVMFSLDNRADEAWLKWQDGVWRYSPSGYTLEQNWPRESALQVLTPRVTVLAIKAGYVPTVHPTAAKGRNLVRSP